MAAVIGARLFSSLKQALKLPYIKTYFWTDSFTVLTWITRREQWSVFDTNRISEIRKLTTSEDWLHISTDQNPADILSRGCGPKQLQKCKWWQGPACLQNPKEQWPKSAVNIDEKEVEIEKRKSVISANNTELESISLQLARRISRFSKMIRVMAWVLRFQPKAKDFRKYTELTNEELLNAQKIIFRVVQKECYSNEETRKNLRGLQVFEDGEGILRLKSRLINEEELKYFISPIILPSKHLANIKIYFSDLLWNFNTSYSDSLNVGTEKNNEVFYKVVGKQHYCLLCSYSSLVKTNIIRHVRSHTNERPHCCPMCNKSFITKESCQLHIRTHSGEQPYVCNICGKAFTQRGPGQQKLREDAYFHWPDHKKVQRRCVVCKDKGIRRRTSVSCKTCNVGLCVNCFEEFHVKMGFI
ncbi:uncharacterized protein NPIL_147161 [Nephila pilipes]|uniref:C2H2-type domain-containing protein n=1 Tax=Nephila pilipes TaxID=299642 RepID=A0A8X6QQC4_NEPPI|nr:uncharacterized protein NPIL_147161 [Nephila pilipes]